MHRVLDRHLQLVAELERLHPEVAPLIDYKSLPPGTESVETLSIQLFQRLKNELEDPVFMAFCHLNSERLIDYLDHKVEQGAFPLDVDEIVSEVYLRLHRYFRGWYDGESFGDRFRWKAPSGSWTLFHMLASCSDAVIEEQLEILRASSLPVPGIRKFRVSAHEDLVARVEELLDKKRVRLEKKDIEDWVVHAFLMLDAESRQVLFLKGRRGLSIDEIAQRLGVLPIEAARRLAEARSEFHQRVLSILIKYHPEAQERSGEDAASRGTTDGEDSHDSH